MSFTYNPRKKKRARSHGFLSRSRTKTGKKVLIRRRRKGRKKAFSLISYRVESMLSKKNRANTKEVASVFKNGKFLNSSSFSFRYVLDKHSRGRKISFIAPKSVAKGAVERNRLRRLGYVALRGELPDFPASIVGVFIFKKYQDDVPKIKDEIKNLLNKIN